MIHSTWYLLTSLEIQKNELVMTRIRLFSVAAPTLVLGLAPFLRLVLVLAAGARAGAGVGAGPLLLLALGLGLLGGGGGGTGGGAGLQGWGGGPCGRRGLLARGGASLHECPVHGLVVLQLPLGPGLGDEGLELLAAPVRTGRVRLQEME